MRFSLMNCALDCTLDVRHCERGEGALCGIPFLERLPQGGGCNRDVIIAIGCCATHSEATCQADRETTVLPDDVFFDAVHLTLAASSKDFGPFCTMCSGLFLELLPASFLSGVVLMDVEAFSSSRGIGFHVQDSEGSGPVGNRRVRRWCRGVARPEDRWRGTRPR